MKISENQNLKDYNTFGMEVFARRFLQIENAGEVPALITEYLHQEPFYILGGGSNTLFTKDFDGSIVHPVFTGIEVVEQAWDAVVLRVAAGEPWDNLIQYCIRHELFGIENLTGIPGWVGSAPVQNIGAYGVEVKDTILKVEGYVISTGKSLTLSNAECRFAYRNSIFKQELKHDFIITHVWFQLSKKKHFTLSYQGLAKALEERELPLTLHSVSDCVRKIRDTKLPDPKIVGNGGSFFKNPMIPEEKYRELQTNFPDLVAYDAPDGLKKLSAGQLIEKAGWKGKRLGNAGTWKNQALVLVNYGGATPKEVLEVAETIIHDVNSLFDITLEMEINRI
ncbi:MAG: UDP-N-acetylmuramate dehydrogenase [Bacteroidales bacterium]|nr:UDP-N-acetylmuramate dehydrogenase [Bacteroidales bacterium]